MPDSGTSLGDGKGKSASGGAGSSNGLRARGERQNPGDRWIPFVDDGSENGFSNPGTGGSWARGRGRDESVRRRCSIGPLVASL